MYLKGLFKNKKFLTVLSIIILISVIVFINLSVSGFNTTETNATEIKSDEESIEDSETAQDIIWEEDTDSQESETNNSINPGSDKSSGFPYLIKINRQLNCVTVYSKDQNGEYVVPVKAMVCSTGTDTPVGTFKTSDKYTWRKLVGNVWGQYAYRITGSILFHSVPYFSQNKGDLETAEFNKLGQKASLGCIRLQVIDAKWLVENCPKGTTVIIYDDASNPGPLGKPTALTIPETMKWDPTDPDAANPWITDIVINGAENKTIEVGSPQYNLLNNIKAYSGAGTDITGLLSVSGNVNTNIIGDYPILYTCVDAYGHTASRQITVSVKDRTAPVISFAYDNISVNPNVVTNIEKYIIENVTVTDYSLKSVTASPVDNSKSFSDFIEGNTYQVQITATDNFNNSSFKIISVKYSSPEIKWILTDNQIANTNVDYLKSCVNTVFDNGLEGVTNVNIDLVENNIYNITYTATDSYNNTTIMVKQVILQ